MGNENRACKLGSYQAYCDMEKEGKPNGPNSIPSSPSEHNSNQNNIDDNSKPNKNMVRISAYGLSNGFQKAERYIGSHFHTAKTAADSTSNESFLLSGVRRPHSSVRQNVQRVHMEVHLPKASRVIRQNQLPNTGKPVHENNNGNAQPTTDQSGNGGYAREASLL